MENRRILVDTSVLIDFLRKEKREKSLFWRLKKKKYQMIISSITVFELYAGAKTEKQANSLAQLFKMLEIETFTSKTAKIASSIYRELKQANLLIEFRDIFIAATAQQLEIPVVTLNEKHFKRISSIKMLKL